MKKKIRERDLWGYTFFFIVFIICLFVFFIFFFSFISWHRVSRLILFICFDLFLNCCCLLFFLPLFFTFMFARNYLQFLIHIFYGLTTNSTVFHTYTHMYRYMYMYIITYMHLRSNHLKPFYWFFNHCFMWLGARLGKRLGNEAWNHFLRRYLVPDHKLIYLGAVRE